ncbi:hypothetical protein NL676_011485 [Syzygium grande]|nr:hypothetical protein NL676_011485 [Syzygium grande]
MYVNCDLKTCALNSFELFYLENGKVGTGLRKGASGKALQRGKLVNLWGATWTRAGRSTGNRSFRLWRAPFFSFHCAPLERRLLRRGEGTARPSCELMATMVGCYDEAPEVEAAMGRTTNELRNSSS